MDPMTDPALTAFREEVRAFLESRLTDELRRGAERATSVFVDPAISLPWQRILHARGWAAPDWPAEHGGPGWSELQRYIFAAECARARATNRSEEPRVGKEGGRTYISQGSPYN